VAFAAAAAADVLSGFLAFAPPVQWAVDLVTAIVLFIVLGWQWILLPGLIMEAIPGLYVFPFWVLVVGAVAMWGTARPKLKG
jgi:MFS superfamily sulfate permease-like transporter